MTIEGVADAVVFRAYVFQVLVPTGYIVVVVERPDCHA